MPQAGRAEPFRATFLLETQLFAWSNLSPFLFHPSPRFFQALIPSFSSLPWRDGSNRRSQSVNGVDGRGRQTRQPQWNRSSLVSEIVRLRCFYFRTCSPLFDWNKRPFLRYCLLFSKLKVINVSCGIVALWHHYVNLFPLHFRPK